MKNRPGSALCLLTAGLCLVAAAARGQNGNAAGPLFRNRAVVQSAPVPSRVSQNHVKVAEQSLLIRDPRVLDSTDFQSCEVDVAPCSEAHGKWSFASVFQRGMTVARKGTVTPAEVQAATDGWRQDLEKPYDPKNPLLSQANSSLIQAVKADFEAGWKNDKGEYPALRIPVRLLAIVNRIDTAVPDPAGCARRGEPGKDMSGAEIRLEFAGVRANLTATFDYLRFIVEFVLPCESSSDPNEFPRLARDWHSLSALDIAAPAYGERLSQVLDYWLGTAVKARIRIAGASAGADWAVREYIFQPDGKLLPESLERDLPGELATCWDRGSALGKFAAGHDMRILASRYEFHESALNASEQLIEPTEDHVLGLDFKVLPGNKLEEVRHALSINTCRGCHTSETGTNGLHLGQRTKGKRSKISGFLSGASDHGTCLLDYGDGNTQSYCTPRIVASVGCPDLNKTTYRYNDLRRRDLYLDAVLTPPDGASPGSAAWYAAIARYATLQLH